MGEEREETDREREKKGKDRERKREKEKIKIGREWKFAKREKEQGKKTTQHFCTKLSIQLSRSTARSPEIRGHHLQSIDTTSSRQKLITSH